MAIFNALESISRGRMQDFLLSGSVAIKRLVDVWKINRVASPRIARLEEPGYLEMKKLAAPYMPNEAHALLFLNTVKIVDFARRGADGIINAVCFNCMVGNASAAIIEKIRNDYHDIPSSLPFTRAAKNHRARWFSRRSSAR